MARTERELFFSFSLKQSPACQPSCIALTPTQTHSTSYVYVEFEINVLEATHSKDMERERCFSLSQRSGCYVCRPFCLLGEHVHD